MALSSCRQASLSYRISERGLSDNSNASPGARELADTKYSYEAYLERTRQACAALQAPTAPGAIVKDLA